MERRHDPTRAATDGDEALPKSMRANSQREAEATCGLVRRALDEGRLVAAFQPVVHARQQGRVAFHEVLIRLKSPNGRLLAPDQFMPAVSGQPPLLAAIDRVALGRALQLLRTRPDIRLSVNISPATLEDPGWLDMVDTAAAESADIAYRLIVELTEDGGFLRHPRWPAFHAALRTLGVSLALDDFGAGATGFHHFREQRFDILKIDGSFGEGLARNPDSQALVRAMQLLARHFEMVTVIEFIESADDAACAAELGVDCLQGYLFGRPATALTYPGRDDGAWRDRA